MMRMYFLFFAVMLSAVWSVTARAQSALVAVDRRSADEVSPLTLQVALDEALSRNPRLIVLRRQYDHIPVAKAEGLRTIRMHFHPRMPGDLADRIG